MDNVKRYTISIGGKQYSLLSDEGQQAVSEVARTVDDLVDAILQSNSDIPFDKAAVLAAIKLAQRVQKLEQSMEAHTAYEQKLAALIEEHL